MGLGAHPAGPLFGGAAGRELGRIVRFVFVGGLATLVDLAVTAVLISGVGADGLAAAAVWAAGLAGDLSAAAAARIGEFVRAYFEEIVSVTGFLTAFWVSFYGHSRVTFRKKRSLGVLWRLIVLSVFNLWLRAWIIHAIKINLHLYGYVPTVSAMVIVTAISYAGSKYWVFRKEKDLDGPAGGPGPAGQ